MGVLLSTTCWKRQNDVMKGISPVKWIMIMMMMRPLLLDKNRIFLPLPLDYPFIALNISVHHIGGKARPGDSHPFHRRVLVNTLAAKALSKRGSTKQRMILWSDQKIFSVFLGRKRFIITGSESTPASSHAATHTTHPVNRHRAAAVKLLGGKGIERMRGMLCEIFPTLHKQFLLLLPRLLLHLPGVAGATKKRKEGKGESSEPRQITRLSILNLGYDPPRYH